MLQSEIATPLNTHFQIKPQPLCAVSVPYISHSLIIYKLKSDEKVSAFVAILFVSMVSTLDAQRSNENRNDNREHRSERTYSKAEKHRAKKCGKKHKIQHKNHNRKMNHKAAINGKAPGGENHMNVNRESRS